MSFPAVTNVDGSNPGPNNAGLPDTVSMPIGNVWKIGEFSMTLAPVTVGTATVAAQTFAMTGALTTDYVSVQAQSPIVYAGIVNSRVSATGVLEVTFINISSTTSGASASMAGTYNILVARPMPNWTAPAAGSLMDW